MTLFELPQLRRVGRGALTLSRFPRSAVVALALLCTCGVESANPLSPADKAQPDPKLIGTWVSTEAGSASKLTVEISSKTGGLMRVLIPASSDRERMEFEGNVTQVGALRLLNLRVIDGDPRSRGFVFMRYALNAKGALETWNLADAPVKTAIDKGQLKGRRDQYGTAVVTDSSEKLVRFIEQQNPEVLFEKFQTFVRTRRGAE